jgi:hypothetical protein
MNQHEREEQEFGMGPKLWDAGEGVCCSAFQLGACAHTEAVEIEDNEDEQLADVSRHELAAATNDEPF